jgi:multicomponent Na+:H+ antiporter subunit E
MSRGVIIVVWLTAVWLALWESLSWANVLGGLVVALAVVALLPPNHPGAGVGFRPLAALTLFFYFDWKLIQASAIVAWEVITPRTRINPAVVSVHLRSRLPGIATAVASMVSLTPGTLTLEVDEETMTLYIHVLHFRSIEATRESVEMLERLTVAAFPPRQVEAQLFEEEQS